MKEASFKRRISFWKRNANAWRGAARGEEDRSNEAWTAMLSLSTELGANPMPGGATFVGEAPAQAWMERVKAKVGELRVGFNQAVSLAEHLKEAEEKTRAAAADLAAERKAHEETRKALAEALADVAEYNLLLSGVEVQARDWKAHAIRRVRDIATKEANEKHPNRLSYSASELQAAGEAWKGSDLGALIAGFKP